VTGRTAGGGCVFDRIRDGELAADMVLDEPDVLAFLDHHPLFPGHTLVVPRRHVATLAELTPELAAALLEASRRVAAAQRDALGSQGTFLALNDLVSQSVPHVHFHVVPRNRGDGLRGFFWPRSRYAAGEAAEVAARLREALLAGGPAGGGPTAGV
jgi:histidine triad (HIT) family protein